MKRAGRRLLGLLLLGVSSLACAGEALVLVAHPDSPVTQVEAEVIAALYLAQRTGLDGLPVARPIDLKDRALREQFYAGVADRNLSQLRAYWSKLVFTGKGRPPRAVSVEEMSAILRNDPEAIGYLPESASRGLKRLLELK